MKGRSKGAHAGLTVAWTAKFALHVCMYFLGLLLAYQLRRDLSFVWWLADPEAARVFGWAALYAGIGAFVELVFQAERSAWRYASMREVLGLARNVTLTTALFVATVFVANRGLEMPRSVVPLAWLVSMALLVGARMAWRLPHDPGLATHFLPGWWARPDRDRTPLLIVGSMAEADRQLRLIQGDPNTPYLPVGVITPLREEVGLRMHGVPFIGTVAGLRQPAALPGRTDRPHAIVFLDDPVQGYGLSTERIGELRRSGHTLLKPQNMAELDRTGVAGSMLEEIPLEDFLPRQPVSLSPAPIRQLVAGRRVMVTGAGGSIGSEICRQLLSLGCAHLTMVDHSEFLLFEIDRELMNVSPQTSRAAVLANVRDTSRIDEVMRKERPDIVFHAAALKHVALVENNPAEGILTNVLGTWNVVQAAVASGVQQFVLISTDKAVAPTNVMGATKRLAESLLERAAADTTRMTAVRFGNVLGSAGSVVPIFRDQIARGGPVTVTHPDVNRFFMTIPEAVQLVLHSAAIGASAPSGTPRKFLLEMGSPVRIVDLARQMIELSGKVPDVDVKIEFTGLKAGEKVAEILSDDTEEVFPCVEGIMELKWELAPASGADEDVLSLVQICGSDIADVRRLVMDAVERVRAPKMRAAS